MNLREFIQSEIKSQLDEGIWPKSKLADRFEFILSNELKKNFKGFFHVDGYDLYHNDKKVMSINPDTDSASSIVKKLKSKIKESVNEKYTGNPGDKLTHKYDKNTEIELIEPTNRGWKVYQTTKGKRKITYFDKQDIVGDKALFESVNESEQLDESAMSELDILAKEARDLKSFVKNVFKEFDNLPKTKDTLKWLEGIYNDSINELFEAENPCWDGYKQVGMKMKDGKEVPNCVPKNESVNEMITDGDVVIFKKQKGEVPKITYNSSRKQFAADFLSHTDYYKNLKDAIEDMQDAGFKIEKHIQTESEQLDEKLITFSNRAPYGQIVFMAGGAGSGKGFAIDNFIDAAGFKVRDVDEMKKAVGKLDQLGKFSIDDWFKKYASKLPEADRAHVEEFVVGKGMSIADVANNLKNPNNVAALHYIVDSMGLKDKWLINMLSGKTNKETLPNLLFDITAKKVSSISDVIKPLVDAGYDPKNIHLIWVLTNYHLAVKQNKDRARVVPDDILLGTHEGAAKTIWGILTKGLPKGLNGRIDVILNNRENTVTYKDSKGNTMDGAVKGFLSLPVKKQGGGTLPEKVWKQLLYKWISDNGPKTIDLSKPLDRQMRK